jgi:hypothetical protein
VESTTDKISENLENLKTFFKVEDSKLKSIIQEYPIILSNLTTDIHKLEFYFNLYLEMNKESFHEMATKFPLLLTATVKKLLNIIL